MTLKNRIAQRFQHWLPSQKDAKSLLFNAYDVELQNIRRALGVVDTSVQQAYLTNDAVFAVTSRFVLAFQEPQILVYDKNGEVLPNHPIRSILAKPNAQSSESDLYAKIAQYWATGGVCYLHKLRNQRGIVVGLRAYSAAQMLPQYMNGITAWYQLNYGGQSANVPVEDVIYVPFPIQDDEGRGIPPFLPSMLQVMTDSEATRYLYAVLKNDAVPRTVIAQSGDMQLGSKERERVRDEFADSYGGVGRGKPIILPSGASMERISLSLQELTLDALRKVPEARLCAALQMPPELVGLSVGLENSTYSNKAEARKSYTESTLVGYWTYCAEAIERGLYPDFGDEFELGFDLTAVAALQENQNEKQSRVVVAFEKGIITRNEARMMLGLDAVQGQDVFVQDIAQPAVQPTVQARALQAIEEAAYSIIAAKALPEQKNYCGGEGCTGEGCTNVCPKNADFYAKDIVLEWKNWDERATTFADALSSALQPVFDRLGKEILRNAQNAAKSIDANTELFDLQDFKDALANASSAQIQAFLLLIARAAAAQVNTDWESIQDDFARELGKLFGATITKITDVADTLREELRTFLRGIADRPVAEITEKLQQQYGNVLGSPARVARIARTTATAATAGSQRTTWETAGFKVQWLTQRDSRVRDSHRAMDGKEVDADGLFRYTDENGKVVEGQYPANMSTAGGSVNCRCYLRPVRKQ